MNTNSCLSTTEPIQTNKLNKQNRNRITEIEITWRVISGEGDEGKDTGNKKHKWQVQNRQEEVKNSIENEEAKELRCTTHGHELRGVGWGMPVGGGMQGRGK